MKKEDSPPNGGCRLCFAQQRAEDGARENFALMEKALRDVVPLRYEEVSGQLKSRQWNALMREHHYLGYGQGVRI